MMNQTTLGQDSLGRSDQLLHLQNDRGIRVTLSNFGARLISILSPDKNGQLADVCLGFDSLTDYQTRRGYLGATVGRWANRIAGASFQLNGKTYALAANNGANTLHGGLEGFDKKFWDVVYADAQAVTFFYLSKDGEEGFPGSLRCQVRFSLDEAGRLAIAYEATCDQDTVLNLTNHAYFNLAGAGTIHDHLLQVHAQAVTEATPDLIPTGRLLPVAGTPYDLCKPTRLSDSLARVGEQPMFDSARGFDIHYVVDGSGFREAAILHHPASGRVLRVFTDQPGMQVYTGQGLKGLGKGGREHLPYSGIALETQHHPDAVHQPHFPSTVLMAGEVFRSQTVYQFTTQA